MSGNKKGPWQLASADGGMASMTRVIASFPATGLTTEEIGLRFAHASSGIALCRAAGLIEPVVIRGVAGWRPSRLAYGVRHEIFVFESRLAALLTSNTLPSQHPGGALILARANDGAALVVRHNYAWPPRSPAAAEMMEAAA